MSEKRFNIRVYGLVINDRNEILLSDERVAGVQFTKFPGGGLEWGEGPADCLKREFLEELNQPIEIKEHIYTTDFFQRSAFRDRDQLLSLYYHVELIEKQRFNVVTKPFDFSENASAKTEVYRWVCLSDLRDSDVHWPIDKYVVGIIKKRFG